MNSELIPVDSSVIRAVGYADGTLYVEFHSGRTYTHPRVPYSLFEGLLNATSHGIFYNRHIRGKFK